MLVPAVHVDRQGAAVSVVQRGLEGFRKALADFGPHLETVHHHVNRVLGVLFELGQRIDVVHGAVYAHPDKTLRPQFVDQRGLLALAVIHDRRKDHQPGVLGQLQHVVDHLRDRLCCEHRMPWSGQCGSPMRANSRRR